MNSSMSKTITIIVVVAILIVAASFIVKWVSDNNTQNGLPGEDASMTPPPTNAPAFGDTSSTEVHESPNPEQLKLSIFPMNPAAGSRVSVPFTVTGRTTLHPSTLSVVVKDDAGTVLYRTNAQEGNSSEGSEQLGESFEARITSLSAQLSGDMLYIEISGSDSNAPGGTRTVITSFSI